MNTNSNQAAADAEYQSYDFGDVGVEDASGWEHTIPGDEWTRAVFVRINGDAVGRPTQKVNFTVRFAPGTADVVEAYAIDSEGSMYGSRTQQPEPVSPMALTLDLTLNRQPRAFVDEADALAWITSCLNCNVNHVRAEVVPAARTNDRTNELEAALRSMWVFATGMVDRHGTNGDDSLTDADHAAWQDAAGKANRLLGAQ